MKMAGFFALSTYRREIVVMLTVRFRTRAMFAWHVGENVGATRLDSTGKDFASA